MIAKIIEACVRNRVLVLLIWLLITAWGIYCRLQHCRWTPSPTSPTSR